MIKFTSNVTTVETVFLACTAKDMFNVLESYCGDYVSCLYCTRTCSTCLKVTVSVSLLQLGDYVLNQEQMKELHKHNIDSESFEALPLDVKHEILSDLKDSNKRTDWATISSIPKVRNIHLQYFYSCLNLYFLPLEIKLPWAK